MESNEYGLNIDRRFDRRSLGDVLSDWQTYIRSPSTEEFLAEIGIGHCVTEADYWQVVSGSLQLPPSLVTLLGAQIPPEVASATKLMNRWPVPSPEIPVLSVSESDITLARCQLLRAIEQSHSGCEAQLSNEPQGQLRDLLTAMVQDLAGPELPEQSTLFNNISAYLKISPRIFFDGGSFDRATTEVLTATLAELLHVKPRDFEELATRMKTVMCKSSRPPPTTELGQMLRCARKCRGIGTKELTCSHRLALVERGFYPSAEVLNTLLDELNVSTEEREIIKSVHQGSREEVPPKLRALCSQFPNEVWTPSKLLRAAKAHPQLLLLRTERVVHNVRTVVDAFSDAGLSTDRYQSMTLRQPRLLGHKPLTIITNARKVIEHFQADGLTEAMYISGAQKKPQLLLFRPETLIDHLERSIELFSDYGCEREQVVRAAVQEPALLTMRPDRTRKAIEKVVSHFSPDGLTARAYVDAGMKCPMIFSRNPETVIGNIEILCGAPHSERREIVGQMVRVPRLLGLSADNMLLRTLDASIRGKKVDFWGSRRDVESRLASNLAQREGGAVLVNALANDGLLPSISSQIRSF